MNNKDHTDEATSNDDSTKKGHINSNGSLDGTKSRDSPVDVSKDSSKAPSIDGASDADVSSHGDSKDENSQNSTAMEVDSSKPKNGAPLEPSEEAHKASLDTDKQVSESSVNSTLTTESESNSSEKERTASLGKSGDKLCDSNAKENDEDVSKKDAGNEEKEEEMEVDGEVAKETKQDSAKPTNGMDSIDTEGTDGESSKQDATSKKDEDVSEKEEAKEDSTSKDESKETTEKKLKDG